MAWLNLTPPQPTRAVVAFITAAVGAAAGCGGDASGQHPGGIHSLPDDVPSNTVDQVHFDPRAEDHANDVDVRLESRTSGATLCYTVDGTAPACDPDAVCAKGSTTITYGATPVHIDETGTQLRAIACKKGMTPSGEMRAEYTFTAGQPTFFPGPGIFDPDKPEPITLATTTRQGVIHYTTDGSLPDCESPLTFREKGTLPVFAADTTLHAITCKKKYASSTIVKVTYPGRQCNGDFNVFTRTQLEELSRCRSITGSLAIFGTEITDLTQLRRLEHVNGALSITNLDNVRTLDGLQRLTDVGGALEVQDNPALAQLDALEALRTVGGILTIEGNALPEWQGPKKLTTVGGLWILRESKLRRVGGFPALTDIRGPLRVEFNGALEMVEDMPELTSIPGYVSFVSNGALKGVFGFDKVSQLGGLTVDQNDALVSFMAFGKATTIHKSVALTANPALSQIALKNVATIEGALTISSTELADLTGLGSLTRIDGELAVSGNKKLTKVDTLTQFTSYGGRRLDITDNDVLPECQAKLVLQKLQERGYNGGFNITGNHGTGTCN